MTPHLKKADSSLPLCKEECKNSSTKGHCRAMWPDPNDDNKGKMVEWDCTGGGFFTVHGSCGDVDYPPCGHMDAQTGVVLPPDSPFVKCLNVPENSGFANYACPRAVTKK